jgi:hypothetical protein
MSSIDVRGNATDSCDKPASAIVGGESNVNSNVEPRLVHDAAMTNRSFGDSRSAAAAQSNSFTSHEMTAAPRPLSPRCNRTLKLLATRFVQQTAGDIQFQTRAKRRSENQIEKAIFKEENNTQRNEILNRATLAYTEVVQSTIS